VTEIANPQSKQDAVNLITLQDLEICVLEQATNTVNTVVNDAIHNLWHSS